jgi:hypothetical protein
MTIKLALNLEFSNGQQVVIVSAGRIGVHKPSVEWDPAAYLRGVPYGHRSSLGVLSVGIGQFYGDPNIGRLNWGAKSRLLGEARATKGGMFATVQLIQRETSCVSENWLDWRLDNGLPYNIVDYYGHPEEQGLFYRAQIRDSDAPTDYISFWTSWGVPFRPAFMTDQFQQFFMYRPETLRFFGGAAPRPAQRSAGIPARPQGDRPRRAAEKLGNEWWGRCLQSTCRPAGAWGWLQAPLGQQVPVWGVGRFPARLAGDFRQEVLERRHARGWTTVRIFVR